MINSSDIIPLDKLISKYSQITKLAKNLRDNCSDSKLSNKNIREISVLYYLKELKDLHDNSK